MTLFSPLRVNALNVGEAETKAMPAATFFSTCNFMKIMKGLNFIAFMKEQ